MNVITDIMTSFFWNEKINTFIILLLGTIISVIETYGISKTVALIISHAQTGNLNEMKRLIQIFSGFALMFIVFNYLYEFYKNKVILKLRYWIRGELLRILMKSNNENFTDKNFIKLNSPINRISNTSYFLMNNLFTYLVPSIIFILVVFAIFTYNDPVMGGLFIIANFILATYMFFVTPTIVEKNITYEMDVNENESHVLEMLNNIDKIVYRGQTLQENINLEKITEVTIEKSKDFFSYVNTQESILGIIMYCIIIGFLIYNIQRVKNNKITKVVFITFVTIILLYKDKISVVIWQTTEFAEFNGRIKGMLKYYNEAILLNDHPPDNIIEYKRQVEHHGYLFGKLFYKPVTLPFNKITFKNVSFKYRSKDVYVFKNFSMEIHLNNKIIGFTGISGRGKTTLMKLVLKMYKDYEGEIYIDDVNIREIDPDYLRKNIVYINQHSKLFDRTIIENIMYGCAHTNTCDANLKQIIQKYPKIRELFKDNNIYTTRVGPLGEKMSGGQRMIISILTGLISPSHCGLVLDEPTGGLDMELKKEVIDLIRDNRKNKKFILIVSHDKDIYRIFDERKEI